MENKYKILIIVLGGLLFSFFYDSYTGKNILISMKNMNVTSIEYFELRKKTLYDSKKIYFEDEENINIFFDMISVKVSEKAKIKKGYDYMYQIIIKYVEGPTYTLNLYNDENDKEVFVYINQDNGGTYSYMVEDNNNVIDLLETKFQESN